MRNLIDIRREKRYAEIRKGRAPEKRKEDTL